MQPGFGYMKNSLILPDLSTDVTLAQSGALVGYAKASFGSVSPTTPTLNGQEVNVMFTDNGTFDFEVGILGSFLAQTFFTSVTVEDGDGTPVEFLTADAVSFTSNSTSARWDFGDGTAAIWDTFDDPEVHDCDFFL